MCSTSYKPVKFLLFLYHLFPIPHNCIAQVIFNLYRFACFQSVIKQCALTMNQFVEYVLALLAIIITPVTIPNKILQRCYKQISLHKSIYYTHLDIKKKKEREREREKKKQNPTHARNISPSSA